MLHYKAIIGVVEGDLDRLLGLVNLDNCDHCLCAKCYNCNVRTHVDGWKEPQCELCVFNSCGGDEFVVVNCRYFIQRR